MSAPIETKLAPISDAQRDTFRRFAREQLRDAAHWAEVAGHGDVADEIDALIPRLIAKPEAAT